MMEGTLLLALQRNPGLSVLLFSLMFRVVHRLLRCLPAPKAVQLDEVRCWKWRNLCVSLVHAMLTGPWAVTCVCLWPEMLSNIHSYYTPMSYLLLCVSTGYFLQDTGDILFSGHARGSWEFLLHHFLVLWCFLYSLYTQRYVSGMVIALLVELNSVTLHARLLLKLAGAQASQLYHTNKLLNLFTYITFRLSAQFYLSWYLLKNLSWLDHSYYFLVTVVLMNTMILIYFYRLLRADFFPRRKLQLEMNGTHSSSSSTFLND
ncbi:TLC domain-containing protein 1 [Astyanax mexicanus]|uniref:Calfacilitin-like n=1 Tax=Astyanax mexicanus TaxID=7994 RepID=A0A8B9R7E5_ASTMX|nr:TLC domain-containing protein 1 [Astyanax mexicanus]KAG9265264.1 calfacilitin-like [Astyanax mexicanus]